MTKYKIWQRAFHLRKIKTIYKYKQKHLNTHTKLNAPKAQHMLYCFNSVLMWTMMMMMMVLKPPAKFSSTVPSWYRTTGGWYYQPPVVCRQGVVRRGSWKGWQIINILQQILLLSWTSLNIYICNTYIFLKASLKITSNKFYILDRRSLYYKKLPKPSPRCFLCFTLMLLNLRGKKIQLFWKFKESFLSKQWFFHFFCK